MSTTRKARKEHRCSLCALPIQPGERYEFQRITPWDHPVNESFFSYRAHRQCDDVWQEVASDWDYEFPDCFEFREVYAQSAPTGLPSGE